MKYIIILAALFLFSCHQSDNQSAKKVIQFHVAVVSFGTMGVSSDSYVIHATKDNWNTSVDVLGEFEGGEYGSHWIGGKDALCKFAAEHVKNWDSVLAINNRYNTSLDAWYKIEKEKRGELKMDTSCIY